MVIKAKPGDIIIFESVFKKSSIKYKGKFIGMSREEFMVEDVYEKTVRNKGRSREWVKSSYVRGRFRSQSYRILEVNKTLI